MSGHICCRVFLHDGTTEFVAFACLPLRNLNVHVHTFEFAVAAALAAAMHAFMTVCVSEFV